MADVKETIADVFGRTAATYSTTGVDFFVPFGRRLVELAEVMPGERVLDVCAGAGASAAPAAERGAIVTAVDLAPGMVERLRENGIIAHVMDAEALQFPDATFDLVLCGFGFFFCPDPERAFAEARRVLRPGGRLAFSSFAGSDRRWSFVNELFPKAEDAAKGDERPPDRFGSQEAIAELVVAAGFDRVRFVEEDLDTAFADVNEVWAWMWSTGYRESLESLGEGLEDYQRQLFARIDELGHLDRTFSARFTLARRP